MKVLVKSARGSDDPTKAGFPFVHSNSLAEAGHEVQIFLLGDAVSLMRDPVANAIVPVGWPTCGDAAQDNCTGNTHSRLRCLFAGPWVLDIDLIGKNASLANPSLLVGLIEWADKLLTE